MTVPVALDLKIRYPEFDPLSDDRVSIFINEASRSVSTDWVEADYTLGIIHLAAHLMALEGEPGRSLDPTTPVQPFQTGRAVKRRKVGDVETEYAVPVDGISLNDLDSSQYGAKFKRLLRLNAPAIAAV